MFPFLPRRHLFFAALLRPVRAALFQRDGKMMYNYDDFLVAIEQMSPRHYRELSYLDFDPISSSVSSLRHRFLTSDTSNFGRCWQKGPSASYFLASMHPSHSRRDTVRLMRAVFFLPWLLFFRERSSSSAIPLRLVWRGRPDVDHPASSPSAVATSVVGNFGKRSFNAYGRYLWASAIYLRY